MLSVLTKLGTLASNVTLSLNTASEEAGVVNIYDIIFTTPADAPSITWPEGISWAGGSAPAIAGEKTYEMLYSPKAKESPKKAAQKKTKANITKMLRLQRCAK